MNIFTSGISKYVNSFGYKIEFDGEDKMFYYRLSEEDFRLINFILSAAAFKYAMFDKINIKFISDFHAKISGILRYEFRAGSDFGQIHPGMFAEDYINEIKDIDYIDLNLASLAAENNGLKLRVYFIPDDGGKVCFDLIFPAKERDLKSPFGEEPGNYVIKITEEDIIKFAEIEFAEVFVIDNSGDM